MPDWCHNQLEVSGESNELRRFEEESRGKGPEYTSTHFAVPTSPRESALSFHTLDPVPDELIARPYGHGGNEQADRVDGCTCGFEWEAKHWGCKWGACEVWVAKQPGDDKRILYVFDTPWGAPLSWLKVVSSNYPTLKFDLLWQMEDQTRPGKAYIQAGSVDEYPKPEGAPDE